MGASCVKPKGEGEVYKSRRNTKDGGTPRAAGYVLDDDQQPFGSIGMELRLRISESEAPGVDSRQDSMTSMVSYAGDMSHAGSSYAGSHAGDDSVTRTALDNLTFVRYLCDFMQLVQRERGLSAVYLSVGRDHAETADVGARLKDIRENALAAWNKVLESPGGDRLSKGLSYDQIIAYRGDIDEYKVTWRLALFQLYTPYLDEIMDVMEAMLRILDASSVASEVHAYVSFLHVKETIGRMRAMLSSIIGGGEVSAGNSYVNDFCQLVGMERAYEKMFEMAGPRDLVQMFQQTCAKPRRILEVEQTIVGTSGGLGGIPGTISPMDYFKMMTLRLDRMHKIEIALLEDIIQAVRSEAEGAKWRLKKSLHTLKKITTQQGGGVGAVANNKNNADLRCVNVEMEVGDNAGVGIVSSFNNGGAATSESSPSFRQSRPQPRPARSSDTAVKGPAGRSPGVAGYPSPVRRAPRLSGGANSSTPGGSRSSDRNMQNVLSVGGKHSTDSGGDGGVVKRGPEVEKEHGKEVIVSGEDGGGGGGGEREKEKAREMEKEKEREAKAKKSRSARPAQSSFQATCIIPSKQLNFIREIGKGSTGCTYLAQWQGMLVACKVVDDAPSAKTHKATALKEFQVELEILSQLRHPNICMYMGASVEPPRYYLVLEYMTRGTLFDLLRADATQVDFFKCALDVARGMQYVHDHCRLMHRDLKSPNLLCDESGNFKIADFGLGCLEAREAAKAMTGEIGTYRWMAPEVIMHEPYGKAADVYSFGIILWELLTARVPYKGLSPVKAAMGVVVEQLRPTLPRACPSGVRGVVSACWAVRPEERPRFRDVVNRLEMLQPLERDACRALHASPALVEEAARMPQYSYMGLGTVPGSSGRGGTDSDAASSPSWSAGAPQQQQQRRASGPGPSGSVSGGASGGTSARTSGGGSRNSGPGGSLSIIAPPAGMTAPFAAKPPPAPAPQAPAADGWGAGCPSRTASEEKDVLGGAGGLEGAAERRVSGGTAGPPAM